MRVNSHFFSIATSPLFSFKTRLFFLSPYLVELYKPDNNCMKSAND